MKTILLCLSCSALFFLCFAPVDLGALGYVALVPWCFLAERHGGWRLFGAGYLSGALLLLAGCGWLALSHPLNLLLMVVFESLYYAAAAVVLRRLLVRGRWPASLALPVLWTAMEYARGTFPLDGFPWLFLGYSQHSLLPVLQVADLAGVWGVTFLLAATGGACFDLWRWRFPGPGQDPAAARGRPGFPRAVLAVALLVVGALGYGGLALGDPEKLPAGPRMLLVQANIEQSLKRRNPGAPEIFDRHVRLTAEGLSRESVAVPIAVWPETMMPGLFIEPTPQEAEREADLLRRALLEPFRCWLLAGVALYGRSGETWNSAVVFDPEGRRRGLAHKTLLVPGGEYLPWLDLMPRGLRDWIWRRVQQMAGRVPDLTPGPGPQLLELPDGRGGTVLAGVTICYEIVYPDMCRQFAALGAAFHLNLSNEAWFPGSHEFAQYTAMAAFRAAESKRSVVRAANSGTSGVIDPWGRVRLLERAGRRDGFSGTLVAAPPVCDKITLYTRWGDWLPCGCLAMAVLLWFLPCRKGGIPREKSAVPEKTVTTDGNRPV